jgi:hypothetical protein
LRNVLASILICILYFLVTDPELFGEWEAKKDVAYDQWMIKNAPELGH